MNIKSQKNSTSLNESAVVDKIYFTLAWLKLCFNNPYIYGKSVVTNTFTQNQFSLFKK